MTDVNKMAERRQHRRFQVPVGVFVTFSPENSRLGEVVDISSGGLSFRYLATEEPPNGSYKLNIFRSEHDLYLNDMPFETVSDFGTYEIPFVPVTMRRSGVQFRALTHNQRSQLEYFIQNHTISPFEF